MAPRLRIASVPAVRRKWRADAAYAAAHAAGLLAVLVCAVLMHPFVLMLAIAVGVARATAIVHRDAEDVITTSRGVVSVTERSQCPVLWDAAREACAAAGLPPVSLYLFEPSVRLPAASWGFLSTRSLGMSRALVGRFPQDWIRATVAHEVSHHAMGDLRTAAAFKLLEGWLRDAAMILVLATMCALLWPAPPSLPALLCALLAGISAFVAAACAQLFWKPHLRFKREFAADALGVALTDDPIGAMGLLLYLAVASGSLSEDPEPRPGRSHPPPLVRVRRILEDNVHRLR